jgi:hypothetical protein
VTRAARQRLAQDTAAVVAAGGYRHADGWVELAPAIDAARRATHLHLPGEALRPLSGLRGGDGLR